MIGSALDDNKVFPKQGARAIRELGCRLPLHMANFVRQIGSAPRKLFQIDVLTRY